MKKKRIAFVVNGLYGGGAEKILQTILRNFDRSRFDITLVNHRQEEVNELYPADIAYKSILKSRSRFGMFGVKVYNKINLWVYDNLSPRFFRRIYLRDKYDVEIAFIEGYATRIVAGGRSAKRIAWVHIDLKNNPWTDIAFRSKREQEQCYDCFDHVVSVSQSVKEAFDGLFGYGGCSSVVYNPVEIKIIREMSVDGPPERDRSVPLFVSVGRLVHQKGYDRLLRVAAALSAEGKHFKIWIVGEGSDRPLLEQLIGELGLEDIVTLTGFRANPYPFIAAADWFVCSSRSEGYSTVVTESLILGTPVISTACAGTAELLGEEGQWGITVGNDEESLTENMRQILEHPALTARYREMARKRGEMFSLERQMNEIYRIVAPDEY